MTRISSLLMLLSAAAFPLLAAIGLTRTAAAAPAGAEAARDWGPPTAGLQIRIRALNAVAAPQKREDGPIVDSLLNPADRPAPAPHTVPGKPLELAVDALNRGKRRFAQAPVPLMALVEVDGTWYAYTGPRAVRAPVRPFNPGDRVENWITVSLEGPWTETVIDRKFGNPAPASPKRLQLTPGKHVLRVAFPFYREDVKEGRQVRVFSNPVEIQVDLRVLQQPGKHSGAAATREGEERGASDGLLLPVYSETRHSPAFLAEFMNDSDAPQDVFPELVLDGKMRPLTIRGGIANVDVAHLLPGQRMQFTIPVEISARAPLGEGRHTLLVRIGGKSYGPALFVWEDHRRTGPEAR